MHGWHSFEGGNCCGRCVESMSNHAGSASKAKVKVQMTTIFVIPVLTSFPKRVQVRSIFVQLFIEKRMSANLSTTVVD